MKISDLWLALRNKYSALILLPISIFVKKYF